jgi:tRNA 2-thiouridine synthesizing protein E
MEYEIDGKKIAANDNGYLADPNDWNEKVAEMIAAGEGIQLTQRHWDMMKYLRDEYLNNAGSQPNTRTIVKAMQKVWDEKKLDTKALYDLFPMGPDKQGSKVAGLPESKRKGGY